MLNPLTLAEAGAMICVVLEATESRKHQANDTECSALGWVSTPTPMGNGFNHSGRLLNLAISQ